MGKYAVALEDFGEPVTPAESEIGVNEEDMRPRECTLKGQRTGQMGLATAIWTANVNCPQPGQLAQKLVQSENS